MNVEEFLKEQHTAFDVLMHRPAYDAQRLAHEVHISGHEVAKTVLLRTATQGSYVVAVLPASRRIDLAEARRVLKEEVLELATELEIKKQCPDCEIGALPPFGSRYGMRTVVDHSLTEDEQIVFESNTHDEAIRMKYDDYRRIEQPQVAPFSAVE